MQFGGLALDLVGEDVLDVGSVDEPVPDHLLDRMGFEEELEHRRVSTMDDPVEGVEHLDEPLTTLDDTLVMEGDVVVGLLIADADQRLLEVVEAAEHVAVVGPEAGEIDIGQEEHPAGDAEPAVTGGVPRKVHGLDGDAAEVPDMPVLEGERVGSGAVVELGQQGVAEVLAGVTVEPVPVEHAVDRVSPG